MMILLLCLCVRCMLSSYMSIHSQQGCRRQGDYQLRGRGNERRRHISSLHTQQGALFASPDRVVHDTFLSPTEAIYINTDSNIKQARKIRDATVYTINGMNEYENQPPTSLSQQLSSLFFIFCVPFFISFSSPLPLLLLVFVHSLHLLLLLRLPLLPPPIHLKVMVEMRVSFMPLLME